MPHFTNAESAAFNEDHNRYMAQEVAADKRDNWVEERVNYLMTEEYSPFLPNHVTEALSELSDADAMLMGSYLQASFNLPENDSAKINLADFVVDRVHDYWHACAVTQAQKEYDEGTW